MIHLSKRDQRILEVMLIVVAIGLTCLVYTMDRSTLITLNLFFLPVVLAAFFLGRYTAGILAVFCVVTTSPVCMLQVSDFAGSTSPLAMGLGVTIWGAVLCLTALLIGTLSDERSAQAVELHDAYVGVVEVLAKYLQGGNSRLNASMTRVVNLSQRIALELKLSPKRIDDLRVAALMQGFSKIEVTTKVISKAVHSLEAQRDAQDFSFHGTDLVYSLGTVLRGAIPILLGQDEALSAELPSQVTTESPIGANILSIARAYSVLTMGQADGTAASAEAIRELRSTRTSAVDMEVLDALECVVHQHQDLVPT